MPVWKNAYIPAITRDGNIELKATRVNTEGAIKVNIVVPAE